MRDFSNRVGVFRLMEVLGRYKIRATVALNSDIASTIRKSSRRVRSAAGNGWDTTKVIPSAQ